MPDDQREVVVEKSGLTAGLLASFLESNHYEISSQTEDYAIESCTNIT